MLARKALAALVAAAALAVTTTTPAQAASGQLTDPSGDFPDILLLSYSNAATFARVSMTYADVNDAQNESFYVGWGTVGARYQVFNTAGLTELRFYANSSAAAQVVPCAGLTVVHRAATNRSTATIPRSCMPKAAARVRFQGIATAGLSTFDETRISPLIARR